MSDKKDEVKSPSFGAVHTTPQVVVGTPTDLATATQVVQTAAVPQPILSMPERIPANWDIKYDSEAETEDSIIAVNTVTNRTFKGTVKEFSAFLKG